MYDSVNRPIAHPRHSLPDPGIPFHTWHLDWIQDLEETRQGNTQLLVAIDRSTRYCLLQSFAQRDAASVLKFLHSLSTKFGAPVNIITDRAKCFLCVEVDKYLKSNGITLFPSSAYHPQTNGMVERLNALVKTMLGKCCRSDVNKWDLFLETVQFNLNARIHSFTGYSPFYLAHGVSPRLPGNLTPPVLWDFNDSNDVESYTQRELEDLGHARSVAFRRSLQQAKRMKETHDSSTPVLANRFQVGEFVRLKANRGNLMIKSLYPKFLGPFIIEQVNAHDSYYLKHPDGSVLSHPVNANDLSPWMVPRGEATVIEESNNNDSMELGL